MSNYLISGTTGGGGGGDPPERKIMHLALKENVTTAVGSIFPPQQFFWDVLRHYPDFSVMDYTKNIGRVTLIEEGTYIVEATILVQIENDTNPVSTLTWYAVNDLNAPTKILLTTSSRNSGQDKVLTHTGRTIIKVPKGSPQTMDFAFAVDDPIPVESISIIAKTFTGADEYLTNMTIEKISDEVLVDLDVSVGGGV